MAPSLSQLNQESSFTLNIHNGFFVLLFYKDVGKSRSLFGFDKKIIKAINDARNATRYREKKKKESPKKDKRAKSMYIFKRSLDDVITM